MKFTKEHRKRVRIKQLHRELLDVLVNPNAFAFQSRRTGKSSQMNMELKRELLFFHSIVKRYGAPLVHEVLNTTNPEIGILRLHEKVIDALQNLTSDPLGFIKAIKAYNANDVFTIPSTAMSEDEFYQWLAQQ